MPKIFVTSDTHFGHSNIIKYTKRPFKNAAEMDHTLIENWNSVVGEEDEVLHLGDFSFKAGKNLRENYVSKLNGKIHLILGNHDNPREVRSAGFESIHPSLWEYHFYDKVRREKRKVVLCHYPMLSWNASFHGRPHLFGHVHSGPYNFEFDIKRPNSYDVGVDNNEFTPIELVDLLDRMERDNQSGQQI